MVGAARRGAETSGYRLTRKPGRGLSNVWIIEKDGKSESAAIRTSRDRHLAFPPLDEGKRWKTLDDVEKVLAAVVDNKADPQNVEVYLFPADEVRRRFDSAYAARASAGHKNRDNYGMWVNIDPDKLAPYSVGSGLAKAYSPIATFSIDELMAEQPEATPADERPEPEELNGVASKSEPSTIADVVTQARDQIARIAGVRPDAIKVDVKIEY
jgi:hypothetical protein